jgi:flagellar basal body-associated protein FliL
LFFPTLSNDLLEVIHDHIGSQAMNQITWIIIILIVVACIVACGEISARLVLHARNQSRYNESMSPDFRMLQQLYYLAKSDQQQQQQRLLLD